MDSVIDTQTRQHTHTELHCCVTQQYECHNWGCRFKLFIDEKIVTNVTKVRILS